MGIFDERIAFVGKENPSFSKRSLLNQSSKQNHSRVQIHTRPLLGENGWAFVKAIRKKPNLFLGGTKTRVFNLLRLKYFRREREKSKGPVGSSFEKKNKT